MECQKWNVLATTQEFILFLIYTQLPLAQTLCVYIRQSTLACVITYTYNTSKGALTDIYTKAWGHTAPEGECVYIRQSMSDCVITNNYILLLALLKSEGHCSAFLYIVGCRFWLSHYNYNLKVQLSLNNHEIIIETSYPKPIIIVIWGVHIKSAFYQYFVKKLDNTLQCINENKCEIFSYHTIRCTIWDLSTVFFPLI